MVLTAIGIVKPLLGILCLALHYASYVGSEEMITLKLIELMFETSVYGMYFMFSFLIIFNQVGKTEGSMSHIAETMLSGFGAVLYAIASLKAFGFFINSELKSAEDIVGLIKSFAAGLCSFCYFFEILTEDVKKKEQKKTEEEDGQIVNTEDEDDDSEEDEE